MIKFLIGFMLGNWTGLCITCLIIANKGRNE